MCSPVFRFRFHSAVSLLVPDTELMMIICGFNCFGLSTLMINADNSTWPSLLLLSHRFIHVGLEILCP
jgi:hypothetical protein